MNHEWHLLTDRLMTFVDIFLILINCFEAEQCSVRLSQPSSISLYLCIWYTSVSVSIFSKITSFLKLLKDETKSKSQELISLNSECSDKTWKLWQKNFRQITTFNTKCCARRKWNKIKLFADQIFRENIGL